MKKIVSILIVLAMLLSVTVAMAERELINNVYTEGKPIIESPESFSILVDDSGNIEDKVLLPDIEAQTGVKVDFIIFPYQVALERKSILISSGDYPDAIGGWLLSTNDILVDGMGEGLYIPIEEYIEQFSPNMMSVLEIPGVRNTMTLPDGHIYTIPYVVDEPRVSFQPLINEKWLERVGLEMPSTTDELAEVLRAFKAQDANGNGDPNDEIPFSGDPNNFNFGILTGYWGVNANGSGDAPYYSMVDGKITFQATSEEFKSMIQFFNGLYQEGLIDPELFTQDLEMWKAKGRDDLFGVNFVYGAGDSFTANEDLPKNVNKYEVVPLPVLAAPGVEKPVYRRNGYGATTFKTQVAITDKAKNPGLIIRWFDVVFETDNSIQFNGGKFGVAMEKLGEEQYRSLDTTGWDEATKKVNEWQNLWIQSLPKKIPLGLKIAPPEGQDLDYPEKDIIDALYEPFLEVEPIPATWTTKEDAEKVSVIQTDIKSYVDQKVAEWVSGEKDINAEWDAYVEQLEKLGLSDLTAMKQAAIDAIPKE